MGRSPGRAAPDERNVVRLDDRVLGACYACARDIHYADNFIRLRGEPVHLSCALVAARAMRDGPDVEPTREGPHPPA
jgi:hypothetical protein